MQIRYVLVVVKRSPQFEHKPVPQLIGAYNEDDYKLPDIIHEEYKVMKKMHSSLSTVKGAKTRMEKKFPGARYVIGTVVWDEDDE